MELPAFTRLTVLILLFGLTVPAGAQFYAPDTEYHDRVQRLFPVEAARVLAWDSGKTTNGIAEVEYKVSIHTNRITTWQISWLDSGKKLLKSAKVEYPESLLNSGPEYYRQVMRQLLASGWPDLSPLKAEQVPDSFWRGASEAAVNREASLDRALRLTQSARSQRDLVWLPELAGLLVHSALPALSGHLTLDVVLEARSAAWLALAEKASKKEYPQLWSPVLFLSGRQKSALDSWTASSPVPKTLDKEGVAVWDLLLQPPQTTPIFTFAIDSTNSAFALALMDYDASVNGSSHLMAEVIERQYGNGPEIQDFHSYSRTLLPGSGGHQGPIFKTPWSAFQRKAWFNLLSQHIWLTNQGVNFADQLGRAKVSLSQIQNVTVTNNEDLVGFKEASELIRLGHDEGIGKLVPTGTASERDILNYGWEAAGLQLTLRYRNTYFKQSSPEDAKPILTAVSRRTQGLIPFFLTSSAANYARYDKDLFRLQHVDGLQLLVGTSLNPFSDIEEGETNAVSLVFMKRAWLRPTELDWQARELSDDRDFLHLAELIESIDKEGGSRGAYLALNYLAPIASRETEFMPKLDQWKKTFAAKFLQSSWMTVDIAWTELAKGKNNLQFAQELEKVYWKNPNPNLAEFPFDNYVYSGDLKAARRFYLYAREDFEDPVAVSKGLGSFAWYLGYALGDADLRAKALQDSACGSEADIDSHILDACLRDNRPEMLKYLKQKIDFFESDGAKNSLGRQLYGFIPLLPALADPQDARHQEAIDYFGRENGWIVPRWIWIEKFKLSREDAISFLGGPETDTFRQIMAAYLEDNQRKLNNVVNVVIRKDRGHGSSSIIARYLQQKHRNMRIPPSPDLKPAGALSFRSVILKHLEEKGLPKP